MWEADDVGNRGYIRATFHQYFTVEINKVDLGHQPGSYGACGLGLLRQIPALRFGSSS